MERLETSLTKLFKCSSCLETLTKITTQRFCKSTTVWLLHRGISRDVLVTNRGQVTTEANRLRRMTMQVTSVGLTRMQLQVCALWRESFISSLSYPTMSSTHRTVLYTEVTFHDDLVAPVRTSHARARADHMHNHGNVEFRTYQVSKPQGSHNVNKTDMSHMHTPLAHEYLALCGGDLRWWYMN